jgi:hypothetical protein
LGFDADFLSLFGENTFGFSGREIFWQSNPNAKQILFQNLRSNQELMESVMVYDPETGLML